MFLSTFQRQAFLERKSLGKVAKAFMRWKKMVGVADSGWVGDGNRNRSSDTTRIRDGLYIQSACYITYPKCLDYFSFCSVLSLQNN